MKQMFKWVMAGALAIFAMQTFTGCSAVHTAVKKRNLQIQTWMSDTIFLDPVKPADKIIYVSVHNTTGQQINIKQRIKEMLAQNGYKITNDPEKAKFMLQANVLKLKKSDLREINAFRNSGYGAALAGAAVGAGLGSLNSGRGAVVGSLLGAAISTIGDAMVEDTYYVLVTDLQIKERPKKGEVVTQNQVTNAKQGSASSINQQVKGGRVNWKIYRTRIVSTANKVNLKFEEAKPKLLDELVRSIAGIFVEA